MRSPGARIKTNPYITVHRVVVLAHRLPFPDSQNGGRARKAGQVRFAVAGKKSEGGTGVPPSEEFCRRGTRS